MLYHEYITVPVASNFVQSSLWTCLRDVGTVGVVEMPGVGCFDPHRPYQPNRLKTHVLAQVHFPVYLWRTPSCQLVENSVRLNRPRKTGYVGAHGRLDWLIEGHTSSNGTRIISECVTLAAACGLHGFVE